MSLSVRSTAIRVRSLLGSRGADVSNLRNSRIAALIDPALELMAYRIAEGPHYRGLQQDIVVLPAAGVASFPAGSKVIFSLARSQVRVSATSVLLTPVDSPYTLANANLGSEQVFYTQDGPNLRFRATDGNLTTYATSVVVTANYIPLLSSLPIEYEGLFIETLAGLLSEPTARPQEQRATVMSEAGRA